MCGVFSDAFVKIVMNFSMGPLLLGRLSDTFRFVVSPGASESLSSGADVQPQLVRTSLTFSMDVPVFVSGIVAFTADTSEVEFDAVTVPQSWTVGIDRRGCAMAGRAMIKTSSSTDSGRATGIIGVFITVWTTVCFWAR